MTNNKMIVAEKTRNIGNFLVGRLLPFKEKRAVGPFVFIDHMGPTIMEKGQAFDVDQHPHIGLSTLTYLFEGEIHHKDSTGADMIITPGSVNFMTAGRGVTHTERTPKHLRNAAPYMIHGYQVWIALPKEKENIAPNFVHLEHSLLPKWKEDHLELAHMVAQEEVHLATFNQLLPAYGVRPTALLPLWHVGGWLLGAGTAALGVRAAMACTVAVESVITEHYNDQLQNSALDAALHPTIAIFRDEEMEHHDLGLAQGAEKAPLYAPLSAAIRGLCRAAIWICARV